ncbi:MAG: nucleoid-associated protein [Clostridia bacterium]|nr:nucleoid-associated protein [Clostridia bacterium]
MFDFEEAGLNKLVVHRVGNKSQNEGVIISNELCDIYNELTENMLKRYFLEPFGKVNTIYKFKCDTDFGNNEIYLHVKNIFENDEANFYNESVVITEYLYEKSTHPNIKYGEVYLVYIKNANIDGNSCDAIGIFKSENKDVFIDIIEKGANQLNINWRRGANIKKLDKGCIIFNSHKEDGYRLVIIDNTNNKEAKYWENDFLNIELIHDSFTKTKEIVDICKNFAEARFEDDKKAKAVVLNNTYEYLKENETFKKEHFVDAILEKHEDKEKLKNFIQEKASEEKVDVDTEFNISANAIKEVKKQINKSIIKLDKTIEIKLTDINKENSEYIERGFDPEKQMYFYKLYFNDEK